MEKYSVVLLKESKIENKLVIDNKIFEESIILCTLPDNFFDENSYQCILKYFKDKIPPFKFHNCYGELVSNEVIAVIDTFNIISNIHFEEFEEIYSRHFIENTTTKLDDIIKKYYSDFWLKNIN